MGDRTDLLGHVPRNTVAKMGTGYVGKGRIPGEEGAMKLFYSWDAVPECVGERCQAYTQCQYSKKGQCSVVREGLKGLALIIFRNFDAILTEDVLFRVGMHLMPLYKSLLKLNIEEMAVDRAVYVDDKGMYRAHPIYKELRETVKQIEYAWKALGLVKAPRKSDSRDPEEYGDPDFVEQLEAEARDRTRRTKKLIRRQANG